LALDFSTVQFDRKLANFGPAISAFCERRLSGLFAVAEAWALEFLSLKQQLQPIEEEKQSAERTNTALAFFRLAPCCHLALAPIADINPPVRSIQL
jgi:hypothetical protein